MIDEKYIKIARKSFRGFFVVLFSLLNPGCEIAEHQLNICDAMESVLTGNRKKLMLSAPPGHAKSTIISVYGPAYALGQNPKEEIIAVSYGSGLAWSFGKKLRRLMATPEYKAIFPETEIAGSGEAGGDWETTKGGTYLAVGRGGSITGKRASLILIDDLLKNSQEAMSLTIINSLPDFYDTTISSRGYPWCRTVLLATRWSQEDLHGYLQKKEPDEWVQLNYEAICENVETDPMHRKEGEALWPAFFPVEKLEVIRKRNKQAFQALYQGNPTVKEGNVVDLTKITANTNWTVPSQHTLRLIAIDSAEKPGISHDESYLTFWLYDLQTNHAMLSRASHGRYAFPQLVDTTLKSIEEFKADVVLIEDASSGTQLIQTLTEMSLKCFIQSCPAKPHLQIRFSSLCQFIAEGSMTYDPSGEGNLEVIQQLASYPFAVHDDAVASCTALARWLNLYKASLRNFKFNTGLPDSISKSHLPKRKYPSRKKAYGKHSRQI